MDVNPTFGHQELVETLSQSSNKSMGSDSRSRSIGGGAAADKSLLSANRQQQQGNSSSSLMSNSRVGEAYRRVGQKLSMQAHGEIGSNSKSGGSTALVRSPGSSFHRYDDKDSITNVDTSSTSTSLLLMDGKPVARTGSTAAASSADASHDRSSPPLSCEEDDRYRKVPKTTYSDHGDHHYHPPLKILRKLTMEGRDSFLIWEQTHRKKQRKQHEKLTRRRDDEAGVSPHRHAFSRLALEQNWGNNTSTDAAAAANSSNKQSFRSHGSSQSHHHHHHHHHPELLGPPPTAPSKGLLSAVLEGHSDSNTTGSGAGYTSASISTKDSRATALSSLGGTSLGNASTATPVTPRGKCLTVPSDAVANDGRDNVEGNLIVCEHDTIRIPRRNLHTTGENRTTGHGPAEYKVQGLLGQGTFAQVFQCLHIQTGQVVAIKIVKNKPAYTRQATVEIDVFRALKEGNNVCAGGSMVDLICYFMHRSHLCLVFELLGQNLYEILKRRQFRGLPLTIVRSIVKQAVTSIRELSQKSIVHCDLKPENVLLVSEKEADELVAAGEGRRRINSDAAPDSLLNSGDSATTSTNPSSQSTMQTKHQEFLANGNDESSGPSKGRIKLIDFGSACFEGYTAHTYIQSRFYRSPEVLVGLPYDSVIDIWSLGCVAAELFLGLPILPGIHEHDQLGRISEMIAGIPDWMLDQGSKASKYYVKYVPRPVTADSNASTPLFRGSNIASISPGPVLPQWRLKTQQEYITSLSQSEIRKKGGLARLEQQPGNRYFKRTRLSDILFLHGLATFGEDKELLPAFVHFLYGLLEPDPWKRWTSFQAVQHPFITGDLSKLRTKPPRMEVNRKEENHANVELSVYWEAPWDPAICRRKLLNVQRMREKQQTMRRSMSGRPSPSSTPMDTTPERRRSGSQGAASFAVNGVDNSHGQTRASPPSEISSKMAMALASQLSRNTMERQLPAGQIGNYIASSSLTSLGLPGQNGQLVVGGESPANQRNIAALPSSFLSGPQSFSGLGTNPGRVLNEGDFALALQRPGVVPGAGTDASVSSLGTWEATPQIPSNQIPPSTFAPNPASVSYSHGGALNRLSYSGQQLAGSSFPGQPLTGSSLPAQLANPYAAQNAVSAAASGSAASPYGSQYIPSAMASSVSVASSVTMSEATPGMDLQQQVAQLQQQVSMRQQQLQPQQQPQQVAMNQQQVIEALPPGYGLQQQQQVFLATAPGGGTYYVTTSATGQPILLQPMPMVDPTAAAQLGQAFQGQPGGFLPGQQAQPSLLFPGQTQPGIAPPGQTQPGMVLPGLPQQSFQQQHGQSQLQQSLFLGENPGGRNGHPYPTPYGAQGQPQRYAKGGTSM